MCQRIRFGEYWRLRIGKGGRNGDERVEKETMEEQELKKNRKKKE